MSTTPLNSSGNNCLGRRKISEKIQDAMDKKEPFFSFEYFVPKTPDGMYRTHGLVGP
jgi:hypothetical protein